MGTADALYEALSLRGLLTGGGALDWTRYCLSCVPLDGEARRLAEWHLKATGGKKCD